MSRTRIESRPVSDRTLIAVGAVGAVLAALCCATPLLAVALSAAGLTALLAKSGYVIGALLIGLGLIALWLYRRRVMAQSCCEPNSSKQGTTS